MTRYQKTHIKEVKEYQKEWRKNHKNYAYEKTKQWR